MQPAISPGMTLHVHPQGDDAANGQRAEPYWPGLDSPLATLEGARDTIRHMKRQGGLPRGGVRVLIHPGVYERKRTFELTAEDSGTPETPIVYAAASEVRGSVRLRGGRVIAGWKAVTDAAVLARLDESVRGKIVSCDLKSLGIGDYGAFGVRGHAPRDDAKVPLELFFDGRPMQLARWPDTTPWPNEGFATNAATATDRSVTYADDRPARWADAPDVWVHGYWGSEWHFNAVPLTKHDRAGKRLLIEKNSAPNDRFFVANVFEELTRPGEYYLDRAVGVLYFYPPIDLEPRKLDGRVIVSMLTPVMVSLRDVSHVVFERLAFECTRGGVFDVRGGRGVAIRGCLLENVGLDGVRFEKGSDHRVESCDFKHIGDTGIALNVGDRANLVPANIRIHNNHFFDISRTARTYHGAINGDYGGYMGVEITNNLIHDLSHTAVFFWGNDIRIERNEIYNVVLQSDDAGAVYTGRDWTFQGNTFRHNFLHHTGSSGRHDFGTMGVYHDDGAGGTLVEDNIFWHVSKAAFAGGGVNTRFVNNFFVECYPAYWVDERGLSVADAGPTSMVGGFMKDRFNAVHADSDAWVKRYPVMKAIHENYLAGKGTAPLGNVFSRNVVWRSSEKWMISPWPALPDYFDFTGNLVGVDPLFIDEAVGDFRLNAGSPTYRAGIQPITLDGVGLVKDEYRTRIERVASRLEVLHPFRVSETGDVRGTVRLTLVNQGDILIEDTERLAAKGVVAVERAGFMDGRPAGEAKAIGGVEFGPGRKTLSEGDRADARITDDGEFEYRLRPGESASKQFQIAIPREAVTKYDLLEFNTRGLRALPARLRCAMVYPLQVRVRASSPAFSPGSTKDAVAEAVVTNLLDQPMNATLDVSVLKYDGLDTNASVVGDSRIDVRLEPNGSRTLRIPVMFGRRNAAAAFPFVQVAVTGAVFEPQRARFTLTHPLRIITHKSKSPLDIQAREFEPLLVWHDRRSAGVAGAEPIGKLRVCVRDNDDLYVSAEVRDENIRVTEQMWDASCVELFFSAVTPEGGKGSTIRQVFLAPAHGDRPASAFLVRRTNTEPEPDIRVDHERVAGGYRIGALIPRRLVGIANDGASIWFEATVSAQDAKGVNRRGALFGSPKAYQENDRYGLFSRE